MTVEEQRDSTALTTNTSSHITTHPENIGQQARLESAKNFEVAFGKLLQKIQKHIAIASSKSLWRVRIELPRSLWTLDRENQRRILQKLKDNDLAPHFKTLPDKILLLIFWSEADMRLTAQEVEALEETDLSSFQAKQKKKLALEQHSNAGTEAELSNVLTIREAQTEQNFALVPLESTEVVFQKYEVDDSSDEHVASLVPRGTSLKETRLAEKHQKKLARKQEMLEIKRARREEKLRQKQLFKNKERLEEREKKKEEKLKRKALKEQRLLNRAKKEKNEEKKKLKPKKKKERKESSSSSERTWSESDLSQSSDSESD